MRTVSHYLRFIAEHHDFHRKCALGSSFQPTPCGLFTGVAFMKSALRMSLLATATVAALGLTAAAAQAAKPNFSQAHSADELLVQFRPGTTEAQKSAALGRVGAQKDRNIVKGKDRIDAKRSDVDLIKVPGGVGLANHIAKLQADSSVELVELNYILQHTALPRTILLHQWLALGHLWRRFITCHQYGSQPLKLGPVVPTPVAAMW